MPIPPIWPSRSVGTACWCPRSHLSTLTLNQIVLHPYGQSNGTGICMGPSLRYTLAKGQEIDHGTPVRRYNLSNYQRLSFRVDFTRSKGIYISFLTHATREAQVLTHRYMYRRTAVPPYRCVPVLVPPSNPPVGCPQYHPFR